MGGANWSYFFSAQSDTPVKLAAFVYAVFHLVRAGYELLKRTAQRANDEMTMALCDKIIEEKLVMAEALSQQFDTTVQSTLASLLAQ